MKKLLYPNAYADSVFDIDLEALKKRGIEALILDIDNTLVSWETKYAPKSVIDWFDKIQGMGFKLCLVSNATEDRVVTFNEAVKLPAIHRAIKPRRTSFLKALKIMESAPEKTAMIGDQVFTDVLGGNRAGLYTILVIPISGKEFLWTQFVRKIERLVVRRMRRKGRS